MKTQPKGGPEPTGRSVSDFDGSRLNPDEAALFLAAARVLLPPDSEWSLHAGSSESLPAPLRKLWLHTGKAPSAPLPMPKQPLAPGILGVFWRRVRAVLTLSPGDEAQ